MKEQIKVAIQHALNRVGYELHRAPERAAATMLGLNALPIRTVLDVGANVGQFAARATQVFPDAAVHCFEPQKAAFDELTRWVSAHGQGRVTAHNLALGDSRGSVQMWSHTEHTASSSLLEATPRSHALYPQTRAQEATTVELTTLDEFASREGVLLRPDVLVKLDVQGYEDRVLRGGEATLRAARACILEVCLEELYTGQATFRELYLRLDALGFTYAGNLHQELGPDGRVVFLDAVFRRLDRAAPAP